MGVGVGVGIGVGVGVGEGEGVGVGVAVGMGVGVGLSEARGLKSRAVHIRASIPPHTSSTASMQMAAYLKNVRMRRMRLRFRLRVFLDICNPLLRYSASVSSGSSSES